MTKIIAIDLRKMVKIRKRVKSSHKNIKDNRKISPKANKSRKTNKKKLGDNNWTTSSKISGKNQTQQTQTKSCLLNPNNY